MGYRFQLYGKPSKLQRESNPSQSPIQTLSCYICCLPFSMILMPVTFSLYQPEKSGVGLAGFDVNPILVASTSMKVKRGFDSPTLLPTFIKFLIPTSSHSYFSSLYSFISSEASDSCAWDLWSRTIGPAESTRLRPLEPWLLSMNIK